MEDACKLQDLENVIEIGTTHLVNLSSRITQNAYTKLTEIQGCLQLERIMPKVSKQEALEKAIIFYHAYKLQELKMMDESENANCMQIESKSQEAFSEESIVQAESMQIESKQPKGTLSIEDALQIQNKLHATSKQIASKKNEVAATPVTEKKRAFLLEKLGVQHDS